MKFAKILLWILVAVLVLFGGMFLVASFQPSEFKIERSTTINAPADIVFAKVNNLKEWNSWSPWYEQEPDATWEYTGPESGVGAAYSWKGEVLGSGNVEITESEVNERVAYKLNFTEPWESNNLGWMDLAPEGEGVKATWGMSGTNNLMSKVMGLFMSMDEMLGKDFDKGLGYLKDLCEKEFKENPPVEEMPVDSTATDAADA